MKRKLTILVLGAVGVMIAGLAFATAAMSTHAVPRTASPFRVSLVPRYKECRSVVADPNKQIGPPNAAHSTPLPATAACGPPQLQSTQVTLGTNNTNGRRVGLARLDVCATSLGAPGAGSNCEELTLVPPVLPTGADVRVRGNASDILCRGTSTACPGGAGTDYNPQANAGPYLCGLHEPTNSNKQFPSITEQGGSCDPVGGNGAGIPCLPNPPNPATCNTTPDMIASADIPGSSTLPTGGTGAAVRITDHWNDQTPDCAAGAGFVCPATVVDQPVFPVPVYCATNGNGPPNTIGSYCGTNTTANALIDGVTDDFKQAVVEVGQVQISAAGACGSPAACPEIFAVQGIYIP